MFAREYIHPLTYVHRDVRWSAISDFANRHGYGTQISLQRPATGTDHTVLWRGAGHRLEVPGIRDYQEDPGDLTDLNEYLSAHPHYRFYEVRSPQERELTIIDL